MIDYSNCLQCMMQHTLRMLVVLRLLHAVYADCICFICICEQLLLKIALNDK